MKVKVLGAHNCESDSTKLVSLLIDDCIALDAGGLTASLSFAAQQKLAALLLTHAHYDHIRDVPTFAMNLFIRGKSIDVYSTRAVYEMLVTHLTDGKIYPDFFHQPPENPTLRFRVMEHGNTHKIGNYRITAVAVNHSLPAVGFQVTSGDGKAVFYTGDTGADLADCWRHISPQLVIIEVTAPNKQAPWVTPAKHLTPNLLKRELAEFQKQKGYLPQVLTVHMEPEFEKQIKRELALVSEELSCIIRTGYEGMVLRL